MMDVPLVYSEHGRIVVKLNQPGHNEVASVFSISGVLIARKPVSEISTITFNTGIYLVKIEGSNINHSAKVFVK